MANDIILLDSEKEAVISYHRNKIASIQLKISELQVDMANSASRIAELTGEAEKYEQTMPLWKKVKHILLMQETVLTTKEIAIAICRIEDKADGAYQKELVNAIGATLKPKLDKGEVFARVEIKGEFFYGLLEWMGTDGNFDAIYLMML